MTGTLSVELLEMALSRRVRVPVVWRIPPPLSPRAWFPVTVQEERVRLAESLMPAPPAPAVRWPPVMVRPLKMAGVKTPMTPLVPPASRVAVPPTDWIVTVP